MFRKFSKRVGTFTSGVLGTLFFSTFVVTAAYFPFALSTKSIVFGVGLTMPATYVYAGKEGSENV